jgi:hypothetical protein
MNWTGGSLQRHSKNAHKGVVQRQKQHFAKVRTALQNRLHASPTPFCPSYLVRHAKRDERHASPVRRVRHPHREGRAGRIADASEHAHTTRAATHTTRSVSASSIVTAGSTLYGHRRTIDTRSY